MSDCTTVTHMLKCLIAHRRRTVVPAFTVWLSNWGSCDRGLKEKQRLRAVWVSSLPFFSAICFWDWLVKPCAGGFKGRSLSWISEERKHCFLGDLQPLISRAWCLNPRLQIPRRAAVPQVAPFTVAGADSPQPWLQVAHHGAARMTPLFHHLGDFIWLLERACFSPEQIPYSRRPS